MKKYYVGIKGQIINKDTGEFLYLVKQNGNLDLPGGRIEDNEQPTDTLMRELKEELPGIENIRITGIVDSGILHSADIDLFLIIYEVFASFPKGVKISNEHKEYFWGDESLI